jgi:hypothetical protein
LEEALIAFKEVEAEAAAKSCANFIMVPKAAKRVINAHIIIQRVILKQDKDKVLRHAHFT